MTARLLVFGRLGQVARALAETPGQLEFAGRERLDLAAPDADIAGLIAAARPTAVINAAAYNLVDMAETDTAANERLNRDAPPAMARACAGLDIPFVHFSTDYVFDGEKRAPYVEDDARAPINAYGRAKAAGEAALEALLAEGARLAVIRTAWVFAPGGGGFFGAMVRLARERKPASVVDDQASTPTPASACAEAALTLTQALLDRDPAARGLFHAAGADGMTRADQADAIFAHFGAPLPRRVATSDFPATPARRPRDTRLSSAKLESVTGWRAPAFGPAMAQCLAHMARQAA